MFWMVVLSVLLVWLPGLGPLIAGIVGGKLAGDVLTGLLAALLPGILLAIGPRLTRYKANINRGIIPLSAL